METILNLLNNEAFQTVLFTIGGIIIAKIFTAKPEWKKVLEKYQGTLTMAIKGAEKIIPDNCENKAVARLNTALQAAMIAIGSGNASEANVKEAIKFLHAELEASGNLSPSKTEAKTEPELL